MPEQINPISSHEVLLQKLLLFNEYEELGKQYYDVYHEPLSYSQYLYLTSVLQQHRTIKGLFYPRALAKQEAIKKQFRENYGITGLTEQDFFREDQNITIEKLLRYIHIPAHKHHFVECSFVISGTCTHIIDGNTFIQEKGCVTTITPGINHELIAPADCLCLTIKIRGSHFPTMHIPNFPIFVYPISFECQDDAFVFHILLEIYRQQETQRIYSEELINELFQVLFTYIMQNYRDTLQILISGNERDHLLIQILNYMFENYQTITLKSLAEHFHFNSSYLSDRIRKQTGKPFIKILKEFKLRQAAELLIKTDMKLGNICEEIGYKNTAQFIREFKKQYNTTPIAYRKDRERCRTF